jgi:prepilin-type N-terminal cleavage/methylation domain-containing protein
MSGFTLLELLVVITILGLILAALSNGVHFAGQAWQLQERRSVRQGDLDSVQNVVRNLIASGTSFEGDATSLRFVSELPKALARAGLYEVELHATDDRLVLDWRPHFKGSSASIGNTETELVKNVTSLNFAYHVEAAAWQTTTGDKTKSPPLIRMMLVLGDGRKWPPLIMAPMVDVIPAVTN